MNEHEVEQAVRAFDRPDTPNLLRGAQVLSRLVDYANSHSDGWPYWKKPSRAAGPLMKLLIAADPYNPTGDATDAQLMRALVPVKAFLTRENIPPHLILADPEESEEESEYTVEWGIEVDAATPREAAEQALRILLSDDPGNLGKVFRVLKQGESKAVVIDLSPGAGTTDLDLSTDKD